MSARNRQRRGRPARARHVLDDDRLPDRFRHHLTDGASCDVAEAARTAAHHNFHDPRWKLLRYRGQREADNDGTCRQQFCETKHLHSLPSIPSQVFFVLTA